MWPGANRFACKGHFMTGPYSTIGFCFFFFLLNKTKKRLIYLRLLYALCLIYNLRNPRLSHSVKEGFSRNTNCKFLFINNCCDFDARFLLFRSRNNSQKVGLLGFEEEGSLSIYAFRKYGWSPPPPPKKILFIKYFFFFRIRKKLRDTTQIISIAQHAKFSNRQNHIIVGFIN